MKIIHSLFIVIVAGSINFAANAKDGKGHGNFKHVTKQASKNVEKAGESQKQLVPNDSNTPKSKWAITRQEREVIHGFIDDCQSGPTRTLPPGLAKKVARGKGLPPGWQKKVAVGQIMPPEVLKIALPLPRHLVLRLPPSPIGTITVAVHGKIVRLLEKTKEILDILDVPAPVMKR